MRAHAGQARGPTRTSRRGSGARPGAEQGNSAAASTGARSYRATMMATASTHSTIASWAPRQMRGPAPKGIYANGSAGCFPSCLRTVAVLAGPVLAPCGCCCPGTSAVPTLGTALSCPLALFADPALGIGGVGGDGGVGRLAAGRSALPTGVPKKGATPSSLPAPSSLPVETSDLISDLRL